MNITKLNLKNFKRFTDLTIDLSDCPQPPRLVLLIGSNGCGKSSVFDSFTRILNRLRRYPHSNTSAYFDKGQAYKITCDLGPPVNKTIQLPQPFAAPGPIPKTAFYGRTAHRANPEIKNPSRAIENLAEDTDRPSRTIDLDLRFPNDVQAILRRIMKEVFSGENMDLDSLRKTFIQPINDSLERIFGGANGTVLRLQSIIPAGAPNQPPQIDFKKGTSTIGYYLLSSGEKEVFNTLLNFFARREEFQDTIYFIDELNTHLHTALQFNLIRDIVEHWLPPNCQLWTASHSLGFIEYAHQSPEAAIIDFDELDFDKPQVLEPAVRQDTIFEIAVPSDSSLRVFPNRTIVLCENKDVPLYSRVDQDSYVFAKTHDKGSVIHHSATIPEFLGLIDGDYLEVEEKERACKEHASLRILPFYSLESLLYHPDNIAEHLPEGFEREAYIEAIASEKSAVKTDILLRLRESRNNYTLIRTWPKAAKSDAAKRIAEALESDEFDVFYPYFDMKRFCPTSHLQPFNLDPRALAKTSFFKHELMRTLLDQ